jgi:nucleotide-binding universal stress UspA family protein
MGLIDSKMVPAHDEAAEGRPAEAAEAPEMQQQEAADGTEQESGGGALASAMAIVHDTLYSKGAAQDLARALRGADDPADALANAAYEIVSMVDQREDGAVPDEELADFAMQTLTEVCEVAEAAGIPVSGTVVAGAMQTMIRRYLNDNGMDGSQIEAAMSQVSPEQAGPAIDQQFASEEA